jgi:NAD(P)-dependent dehydrogenase (short-subunit alcohol dehydrogenase family)
MTSMDDFSDVSGAALVVGGSGGIGRAVVRLLAQRGSDVALTWRSNETAARRLADEVASYGVRVSTHQLDANDTSACVGVVDAVVERHGGLHTLVHAAGPHVPMTHLSNVEPEVMSEQLQVDVGAFFNVVRPALPALRAAEGSIVAVTTAATSRFPVRDGLSSAPKAAVEALVRALAVEEGRYGVRANSVGPGMLTDGMAQRLIESGELDDQALEVARAHIPLRRFGIAHDIAEAVCFLASHRAGFVSGQKLDIDGGYGA